MSLEHLLRRLSVAQRMAWILGLLLLPMAVLSVVSAVVLNDQEIAFRQSVQESIETLLPLASLEHYLQRALVEELEAQTETSTPNFAALTQNIDRAFTTLDTTGANRDLPAGLIDSAQRAWREARPSVQRLVEHVTPLRPDAGPAADQRTRQELQLAIDDVSRARRHLAHIVEARYAHAVALRHTQLRWLVWSWGVTLTVAAVLVALFLRSILRPIRALGSAAHRLGAGEGGVRIPVIGRDELSAVAERFNEMSAYWEQTRQALIAENSIDPLTGVLNRRGILSVLQAELDAHLRHARPLSVFMVDLDRFKAINDTLGHSAGDRALVWVAEKMRECLRDSDHLGRYGGDEFLVVLPKTDAELARGIAQRMAETLRQASACQEIYPAASIGVAAAPDDGWETQTLIAAADAALYEIKRTRRASD